MATRTGISTAPITWPSFIEATDRLREATAALAQLIADTLAVQYHGAAAYLVLEEYDDGDLMNLHSLLDADGRRLFEFHDDRTMLPALPRGSPLADAWEDLDPADPRTLFKAVQGLHQAGSLFDSLPAGLPCDAAPGDAFCLLLSTAARPCCWDFGQPHASRVVRPYSTPHHPAPDSFPLPIPPDAW